MQAMLLDYIISLARLNTGLRTAFNAFAAAGTGVCDLITLLCGVTAAKDIALSENRIDAEIKILYCGVPDLKDDADLPGVAGVHIGEIRLLPENRIDIFALPVRRGWNSPCRQPYHLFVFCVAENLHPSVAEKLIAEGFSTCCKKVKSGRLVVDGAYFAYLRPTVFIHRGKGENTKA